MTLEQKAAQLVQIPYAQIGREKSEEWARRGVGSFLHVFGEDAKHLQKIAIESGAKIPLLFGIDAVHGHCLNRKATIFPTQLSMACAFDPELIKRVAQAAAKEISADGLHQTFSPVLCLGRDIRWGRVDETFGEDPYLAGILGAAMVEGYQGEDNAADTSVIACAKHYIGYGEATGARDSYDTSITYRKIKDTFLPPFEKAVKAGCASVMTAYGSIDGTPCTADKKLLKEILKEQLGFDGFVVTDWQNVSHLIGEQCVAENAKEASRLALESGNDMMMNAPEFYVAIIDLVRSGEADEKLLDEAVERILTVKMRFGLFDNPFRQADEKYLGCEEHLELNKEIARESTVLLKNDGILPLTGKNKILVVGPSADDIRCNYGDWTYFSHPLPDYDTQPVRPYVTLLEGVQELAKKHDCSVQYVKGCEINGEIAGGIKQAVKAAKKADVIVFACGDNILLAAEGCDRADVRLPKPQRELFTALCNTGKSIVTALICTKPLCIPEIDEHSAAVLTNFNSGMFGGRALAEAIFGEINPSGKLPISFPYHVGQQPCYYNQLPGWHCRSYVDMPETSLYSFGHGLSYTSFAYSDILFDEKTLTLKVSVKNTGKREGAETVQVYFRDLASSVMTPVKRLIAFRKVQLKAGDSQELTFTFTRDDFSFVNANEERVTEPGEFELMVGGSSADSDLIKKKFTIGMAPKSWTDQ
ncbi:MAG: glycosyl hydrolase [Clostridia bacterium]|nr:glycosyl hydrolase [Clostridia bacterium]